MLGRNKGVAAKCDGDMVMPSFESSTFVVVEPKLTLEVLVDPLGAPSLSADAHEPVERGVLGCRQQGELRRQRLIVQPLSQEP